MANYGGGIIIETNVAGATLALEATALIANTSLTNITTNTASINNNTNSIISTTGSTANNTGVLVNQSAATNMKLDTTNNSLQSIINNTSSITTNTSTTNTKLDSVITNTGATNTKLDTTNTTLNTIATNTASNSSALTNWLLQPVLTTPTVFVGNSGVGTFTSFAGPYDLYLASPVAPFTPVLYYNSITIQGIITAVSNIANPTLCFQFSYNNSTWFAENIYPRTGNTEASFSSFTLQRTQIPFRYVRISTLGQNITFSNYVVSLQHIP